TFPLIINVTDEDGTSVVINNAIRVADVASLVLTGQLNPSSDSGRSQTDAITNVNQPNFFGLAAPFATVQLLVAPVGTTNFTQVGQVEADSSGVWSITTNRLVDGTYTVQARELEEAGFTTASLQILPNAGQGALVIDTLGPKVTALSFARRVEGQIDLTYQ